MQNSKNKHRNQTIFTDAWNTLAAEMPIAIIAFGVLANFGWVVGLFWLLSYWIVWH